MIDQYELMIMGSSLENPVQSLNHYLRDNEFAQNGFPISK